MQDKYYFIPIVLVPVALWASTVACNVLTEPIRFLPATPTPTPDVTPTFPEQGCAGFPFGGTTHFAAGLDADEKGPRDLLTASRNADGDDVVLVYSRTDDGGFGPSSGGSIHRDPNIKHLGITYVICTANRGESYRVEVRDGEEVFVPEFELVYFPR